MRKGIMWMANALIDDLLLCDDGDFVDEVIARIASADHFEIETQEEEE